MGKEATTNGVGFALVEAALYKSFIASTQDRQRLFILGCYQYRSDTKLVSGLDTFLVRDECKIAHDRIK